MYGSVCSSISNCQVYSEFTLAQASFKTWFEDLIPVAEISKEKGISTTLAAENAAMEV